MCVFKTCNPVFHCEYRHREDENSVSERWINVTLIFDSRLCTTVNVWIYQFLNDNIYLKPFDFAMFKVTFLCPLILFMKLIFWPVPSRCKYLFKIVHIECFNMQQLWLMKFVVLLAIQLYSF